MTEITEDWAKAFDLPKPGNMMEAHDKREDVFVHQGTQMAIAIRDAIERFSDRPMSELKILDFGCGVGRVAMPLRHFCGKPDICVDVDRDAIRYLKSQLPGVGCRVTDFDPPLPFRDRAFDVVFSVSIWTHLTAESSEAWLAEMARILRPGGLALLTTSNYAVLDVRRNHPVTAGFGWGDVTDEMLREQGYVFIETPAAPGTGTYGLASHDPDFIRRDWSRHMEVVDILPGAILGAQDINVLRKPGRPRKPQGQAQGQPQDGTAL